MKKRAVKKGQIIQQQGEVNHKVYYIVSGLLRSYAIDKNGKESIMMFAPEGWTIGDYLEASKPAVLFIDALEDSYIIERQKDLKDERKNVAPIFRRLGVLQTRILMLLSSNALERYEHFIDTYPDIVQRVPQRMIASYLGITPEALSKIKGERRKKHS